MRNWRAARRSAAAAATVTTRRPAPRGLVPTALARFADWRTGGALIALLCGMVLPLSGLLQPLDWFAHDTQMRLLAQARAPRVASDVVLVMLDEATLAGVPEPLALLHPHLGDLLDALAESGARAVGIDLVLPSRSFDGIAPGYDARLLHGILAMRRAGAVVLARSVDEAGLPRAIYPGFVAAAGELGTGFALLPVDDDGWVRRFDENLGLDGASVPTLVGALARRLGVAPHPGFIDFTHRRSWSVLPMHQVLAWARSGEKARLAEAFAGKVVLLGSTLDLLDLHRVPVALDGRPGQISGVFIHAQTLQDLRSQSLLRELPGWAVLVLGALCALAWLSSGSAPRAVITLALAAVAIVSLGTGALLAGWVLPLGGMLAVAAGAAVLRMVGESVAEIRQRRRLRRVFAGYVSPDVMAELEGGRLEGLSSARRFICVLFVDIRGFTTRSERDAPEQVTATLNQLFERATEAIHRHGGTVKEFMGDGVMAFFGAPAQMDDPVRAGFDAARDILAAMPQINEALARIGQAPLAIGMGMACGQAVVGHIGAARRHTYGAVGDCVNLASRLEGQSKELGYPLILSAEVAGWLGPETGLVSLGLHPIKGHSAVEIHAWAPASAGGNLRAAQPLNVSDQNFV
jgi:adenylate cyclase